MPTKVCTKCGIEKEFKDFYKREGTKDGYRQDCKVCHAVSGKRWAQNNKEKSNAIKRKYVEADPERRRSQSYKYWINNKDKSRKYHSKVYAENPKKFNDRMKTQRKELAVGYVSKLLKKQGFPKDYLIENQEIILIAKELIKLKRLYKSKKHEK